MRYEGEECWDIRSRPICCAHIAQLHSRIACVFRRIFISTFPSSHHVAASIGWSLATPLAEQGTGRTRRAVGGAQIRGMVHRGAFQALPNMVEMQEGCARDAQIFADPTTTSTRTRPPTPVRAALTMDTMIHDVVARGGLQKRHRGQQFSQVPPA